MRSVARRVVLDTVLLEPVFSPLLLHSYPWREAEEEAYLVLLYFARCSSSLFIKLLSSKMVLSLVDDVS